MATLGMSSEEKAAIEAFKRDVAEPSMTALILLDFWAEWCGPCKALAPVLDKVVAEYAPRVKLVKINVDENRLIAGQFRVQSIPTIYAIFQGQPVADLSQVRTERDLRHYLDQLLKQLPVAAGDDAGAPDLAPLLEMAEQALGEGDAARALSIYDQISEMAPEDPAVIIGRATALIALGRLDEAETLLVALPAEQAAGGAKAKAALALAREAGEAGEAADLRRRLAQDPESLDLRFDLAGALMAEGDRDGAADALLDIIRRDAAWREGAARDRLLKLFEATGIEDPWVLATRRKLSAILFA